MPVARVQATFQGRSNDPKDQFVNGLYFDLGADGVAASAEQLANTVHAFYNVAATPSTLAIADYLSAFISNTVTYKIYDMADPEPRVPIIEQRTLDNPNPTPADNLPEEVAICISFRGELPNTARRRGRIYVGPLNINALNQSLSIDQATRPNATCLNAFRDTANGLMEEIATLGWQWVIRSTVPSTNYVPVVAGWVNNAFDTQRRRGVVPTSRVIWPNVV